MLKADGAKICGPTAVILAGGLGTRLRSAFANGPKALAPIGGRPFITYLLDRLETQGIERVVMCTGYRSEDIRAVLGTRYGGLSLMYSVETTALGTGGALRKCLPLLHADPALILNGDSWCDFHLPTFRAFHRARHAQGSIWLVPGAASSSGGCAEIDECGQIVSFREKAPKETGAINAGIYLLSRALIESIAPDVSVSLEHDVFPRWAGRGLFGCPLGGALLDIGTPESYAAGRAMLSSTSRERRPHRPHRRVVLVDRDGTICVERKYLTDPAQIELIPGAAEGMRKLRAIGFKVVLLTNQSAVARGCLDASALDRIHGRLSQLLAEEGASLDAIYVCPHQPAQGCECRKPGTAMISQAARDLSFDPRQSFVIGDKLCDVELGRNAGAVGILVTTGYGNEVMAAKRHVSDYVVDSLSEAADIIEYLSRREEGSATEPAESLPL